MNLKELETFAEDKAVEYLNTTRLDALEENGLNQLRTAGYVRLDKLEFSVLIKAIRGLHREIKDKDKKHMSDQATFAEAMGAIEP